MFKITPPKRRCLRCEKSLDMNRGFYNYEGFYNREGKMPVCKECVKELYDDIYENCQDFKTAIYFACRELGVAYKEFCLEQAQSLLANPKEKGKTKSPMAAYMQFLNSNGGGLTFAYSDPFSLDKDQLPANANINYTEQKDPAMIAKWGDGYDNSGYAQLEDLWRRYAAANNIVTVQEQENLKIVCMLTLKYKEVITEGDETKIAKVGPALDKALAAGKLRPMDQVSGVDATGIRSFSDIYAEVEKRGYIKPEPTKEAYDIVDRAIMHIINYTNKLFNKPTVESSPVDLGVGEDEDGFV